MGTTASLPPKVVAFNSNIDLTNQVIISTDLGALGYRSRCEGKAISLYRNGELLADGTMSTGEVGGDVLPSLCIAELAYHDDTFVTFSEADTYTLAIGDEEPIGMAFMGDDMLGTQELYDGINPNIIGIDTLWYPQGDASTFSIAQNVQTTRKKYDIKLLPEECLPKSVAKKSEVAAIKFTANAAQNTANAAQNTANAAQNTANAAQNTANAAQNTANKLVNSRNVIFSITSSSQIGYSTPQFYYNISNFSGEFYKIANLPDFFIDVGSPSFTVTVSDKRDNTLRTGSTGATRIGRAIIVTKAGDQYIRETATLIQHFTATPGIYVQYDKAEGASNDDKVAEFHLTYHFLTSFANTSALLNSSTPNSTKQFKITVDDTGTISATEVTT